MHDEIVIWNELKILRKIKRY